MAGRIPQAFIDDLISRVDIVEVIDQYVPLKKGGRDFKACCPFHNEKTPSFTVSQAKQFYHCFGCQAHGTAIGFLIDYAHMDFVEAVEALAQRVGVEIPREASAEHSRDRLAPQYELMEAANRHFRGALRRHPQAQPAVDYLKGRGLSGEIAAEFQLGFAPPGWENIIDALGRGAEAKQQLVEVGLAIERPDGSLYDRFRNRIIFPIIDRRGRTVGYGGRVLGDDTPKYLNSPETALFHKGRELYGLYHARAAGRAPVQILVVEGYMDVVALAQHGVRNAVATLGTAVTTEHLELLFRVCPDIVYCFDGDEAGRRAAWRGLETTLPLMREGRQALFMFLPDGEDPDSLVRSEGKETFLARAASATSLGTYLFEQLTARRRPDHPGRALPTGGARTPAPRQHPPRRIP